MITLLQQAQTSYKDLSHLLTEIDRLGVSVLQYEQLLNPPHLAFRVGITGAMGVGKSVLINCLIEQAHQKKMKIGVLAIDPTSPLSGGAILGDRIRLSSPSSVDIFFRSIGSRKGIGGLCAKAYLMLRAFDLAGFDIVFVETVGVGQTECEIMNVTDMVSLVLTPDSGDGMQIMKSGLMEIADIFIINKTDKSSGYQIQNELLRMTEPKNQQKYVFSSIAIESKGIKAIFDCMLKFKQQGLFQKQRHCQERLQKEAKALLRLKYEDAFSENILKIKNSQDLADLLLSK